MSIFNLKIENELYEKAKFVFQHKFSGVYEVLKDRTGRYRNELFISDDEIISKLNYDSVIVVDSDGNLLESTL